MIDIVKLKYLNNEDAINKNYTKELEMIIKYGLITFRNSIYNSNSELLHKDKQPTKKVWKKLGAIASEFIKCNTYPKISGNSLTELLNKALGNMDPRPLKDYRKTVLGYCNINDIAIDSCKSNSMFGDLDVSFFVSLIPREYLNISKQTAATAAVSIGGDHHN